MTGGGGAITAHGTPENRRGRDPAAAAQWRVAVREALVAGLADGYKIVGVSPTDAYVLERTT